MATILQQSERDQLLNSLSSEQVQFIKDYVKRGKRTAFANEMAKSKGMVLPEEATDQDIELILDGWTLEDYIDNGFVNPDTPCECGRPLRYQYIVKHKVTNERKTFGISHFEEHMGFPASLIRDIKKGFTQVDYELDELLTKVKIGWNIKQYIEFIPEDMLVPDDVQKQILLNLPLLDTQLRRLKKRISDHLQPVFKPNKRKEINLERNNDIFQSNLLSYAVSPKTSHDKSTSESTNQSNDFEHQNNNEDVYQLDLFTEVVSPTTQLNSTSLVLTQQHKELILHYLESTGSTRIISELLIKKHNASSERYLTGKPRLYLPICMYLDELVELSTVDLIEKHGKDDRIYRLIQD